jgi:hypothetical protein
MRQVVLDELQPADLDQVRRWLDQNAEPSPMNDLYWVEVTDEYLTPGQSSAADDRPFRFAVEVGDDWVKFELLVRSRPNMRSPHTTYAEARQRNFILDFMDRMIADLGLRT